MNLLFFLNYLKVAGMRINGTKMYYNNFLAAFSIEPRALFMTFVFLD